MPKLLWRYIGLWFDLRCFDLSILFYRLLPTCVKWIIGDFVLRFWFDCRLRLYSKTYLPSRITSRIVFFLLRLCACRRIKRVIAARQSLLLWLLLDRILTVRWPLRTQVLFIKHVLLLFLFQGFPPCKFKIFSSNTLHIILELLTNSTIIYRLIEFEIAPAE